MRQTWAAINNNLFSLFWKYYALSLLTKNMLEKKNRGGRAEKLALSQL